MKATKIGDSVTLEHKHGGFQSAVVQKINVKSVTFARDDGQTFNVPGTLQTTSSKMSTSDYRLTVWLDPEEATAEQTKRAEALAQRKAEKQAAAEAQRAKEIAEVKDLVDYATSLHETPIPKEEGEAQDEAICRRSVGYQWLDAHNTLLERARALAQHPASYFEWAEKDMEYAAQREFYDRVIWAMRRAEKPCSCKQAMEYLKEELKKDLLNNRYRGNSSSAAHNAMMAARATKAASIIGYSY